MTLINWSEKYSVGIASMDRQHQQLFAMINKLNDAITQEKSKDVLGPILDELIRYTENHFKAEEDLFNRYQYPDRISHKAMHDDLRHRVLDIQSNFHDGQTTISVELLTFLKDWINTHILQYDQKYSTYLK